MRYCSCGMRISSSARKSTLRCGRCCRQAREKRAQDGPHIHLETLAVLRHDVRRNVSFPVQSLGSIDVRQTSKMAVATEFSKSAPYLYLVNRVRKCEKKYLITLNRRQ